MGCHRHQATKYVRPRDFHILGVERDSLDEGGPFHFWETVKRRYLLVVDKFVILFGRVISEGGWKSSFSKKFFLSYSKHFLDQNLKDDGKCFF